MVVHELKLSDEQDKTLKAISIEINRPIEDIIYNAMDAFIKTLPSFILTEAENAFREFTVEEKVAAVAAVKGGISIEPSPIVIMEPGAVETVIKIGG